MTRNPLVPSVEEDLYFSHQLASYANAAILGLILLNQDRVHFGNANFGHTHKIGSALAQRVPILQSDLL